VRERSVCVCVCLLGDFLEAIMSRLCVCGLHHDQASALDKTELAMDLWTPTSVGRRCLESV